MPLKLSTSACGLTWIGCFASMARTRCATHSRCQRRCSRQKTCQSTNADGHVQPPSAQRASYSIASNDGNAVSHATLSASTCPYFLRNHSRNRVTASGSGAGGCPGSFINIQVSSAGLGAYRDTTTRTYSSASASLASVSTIREPCER